MIRIITERMKVQEFHKRFIDRLDSFDFEEIYTNVGFPNGSIPLYVKYFEGVDMWYYWEADMDVDLNNVNRYWVPFGLGKPTRSATIKVEINVPFELDRKIAGVYMMDEVGNYYVGHRGRIGGGRPGIGKSLFFEHYSGDIKFVEDDGRSTQIAIISNLKDDYFLENIRNFVLEIDKVKNMR